MQPTRLKNQGILRLWLIGSLLLAGCTATPLQQGSQSRQDVQQFAILVTDLADPTMEGRGLGTQGLDHARDYIAQQLAQAGLEPAFNGQWTQAFDVTLQSQPQPVTAHNVAGLLKGRGELAHQYVVVGAHYDHLGYGGPGSLQQGDEPAIHPGADDNASGTAGLILLAQRLNTAMARDRRPSRSILFVAFSAEERGLLGSHYFLNHLDQVGMQQTDQIHAMVNMDMIGRLEDRRLYLLGTGSGDRLAAMVGRLRPGTPLRLFTQSRGFGGSDHVSFHMRQIPAVHAFTGSHPDYHRPSDTADKINAQGGVLVVDLLEKLIRELAVDPQRLVFNPHGVEMHGPGSPGGFRAQLGVMPDYGSMEGDTGCVITAVSPASPAQQAGMQSGDVIVGWNDQHIGNVHDLTAALRHARPGEQVELHILRNGRRMTLQVTLGRR